MHLKVMDINYIKKKYPNEHNSSDRWLTIVVEEIGEIAKAIQDGDINNFVEEVTQSIAALYLMCQDVINSKEIGTPTNSQAV